MMYEPPSRSTGGISVGSPNCAGGCCLWFNNGAFIGCPTATGKNVSTKKDCPHPASPTIDEGDKTLGTVFTPWYQRMMVGDWTAHHPWRFPGSAPVANPCGLNGGSRMPGPTGTGGVAFFGFPQGWKGTEVSPLLKKTTWIAGSEVEVAWGITANHGGGYQYRLCKVSDASSNVTAEATEECFQKTPLEFVGDKQWIQFGDGIDVNNRTEIPAIRLSKGVLPYGSTWTRNPIPACNDIPRLGGHNHKCAGPMFPPPVPGVYGFGPGACASGVAPCTIDEMASRAMPYGIVDKVKIPEHLPPGDYILGFRWDCEQLPQVWSNCADVKIKVKGMAKPTKPFSPWSGCEPCCKETMGPCANCTKCQDDKTGDCEYCWKPLKGYTFGAIPQYTCLGYEAKDGGASEWRPGMPFKTGWSPGCTKCWRAGSSSCQPSDRETQDVELETAEVHV
eukprot:gnl/TRDRNA2_/TRDRNA2_191908_c0_seq1.p1 gnl/TRDRNA2_/TRDRNA2_191908_c0~~gnl/TRDRNA2_/TRDRNA2_191908_c0_seq1.p1  ORF type:complete len:491 (+),score=74.81 gnl/TRDRNA2_/TRDRNA2_191908_c0_seq1:135-1475(+)